MSGGTLSDVLSVALELRPEEQMQLIEELAAHIREEITATRPGRRSLWGVLKSAAPAPSEEEIALARREAWSPFPREDEDQ